MEPLTTVFSMPDCLIVADSKTRTVGGPLGGGGGGGSSD